METNYKIVIFINIVSIVISCISLYTIKMTNDNQKISNIKDNFDINSKAYTTGVSINKDYDNYMEEILYKKKYINCTSYNYGLLGCNVGRSIINCSDEFTTYVDSVNRADKIEIPYPQSFENPNFGFTVAKDAEFVIK